MGIPAEHGLPVEAAASLDALEAILGEGRSTGASASEPDLRYGAMYWVPEDVTGFTRKTERPYVVVAPQIRGQPTVGICPTTTMEVHNRGAEGVVLPAKVLPKLRRESVVLIRRQYAVGRRGFSQYRFIGVLPSDVIEQIHGARRALRLEV